MRPLVEREARSLGRRKSATLNSPWAIVYRDDQARALHQTAKPDHDTLFIDTSSSGKYRKHWSSNPRAQKDCTFMVQYDVYETFGRAPIRIKLRKDSRRCD